MAKRGRPRYPDVLTPREWEVLDLLRLGVSNEEIAARLGITERTAKYHVSEIIGKLGVTTRHEAATWQPAHRPWRATAVAPLVLVWRRAGTSLHWAALAASVLVIAAALGGAAFLSVLLLRGDGPQPELVQSDALPSVGTGVGDLCAGPIDLSPNVERLAFAAGGAIYTVLPDSSTLRCPVGGDRDANWNAAPSFRPDGSSIAFTRNYDLWTADEARGVRAQEGVSDLATPPADAASNPSLGAQSVTWSPDGEHLAYVRARIGGSGIGEVWVMRPDGPYRPEGSQKTRIMTSGAFLLPAWLDSERLAVYESGRIRVFRLTGEEDPSIELAGAERPALSAVPAPEGRWLVGSFLSEGPILFGEPAAMRPIATGVSPALSPDGRSVAYFRGESLRIVAVDGTGDREVIDVGQLGGRDRHFAEEPACFPDPSSACSYRPPAISWTVGAPSPPDPTTTPETNHFEN